MRQSSCVAQVGLELLRSSCLCFECLDRWVPPCTASLSSVLLVIHNIVIIF